MRQRQSVLVAHAVVAEITLVECSPLVLTETLDDMVVCCLRAQIMEKILEKGDSYASTELKRLNSMIDSDVVNAGKKTAFMLRVNVLAAFV